MTSDTIDRQEWKKKMCQLGSHHVNSDFIHNI